MKIFVSKNGQQYGPYNSKQIHENLQKGVFAPSDFACFDGANWVRIAQLPSMHVAGTQGHVIPHVAKPKKKIGCLGVFVGVLVVITCLGIFAAVMASVTSGDSDESSSIEDDSTASLSLEFDSSAAVDYRVLDHRDDPDVDFSFPGRTRLAFDITSDASGKEAKAQTVMLAAFELHREFGGDLMNARLVDYKGQKGIPPAIAYYSPDGGGLSGDEVDRVWDIMVDGEKYEPKLK